MIHRGRLKKSKKQMSTVPKRGYSCKYCGSGAHYSFTCFKRPKKAIPVESETHKQQRIDTRYKWFDANPPDENGNWVCYLGIADNCPKLVNRETIDLEHVRSKGGHPKLRYCIDNIKAACQPCNKLKRSWSIEVLAETYPHIFEMITTPEWQAYERQLDVLEGKISE